jgi:hypothetical protein
MAQLTTIFHDGSLIHCYHVLGFLLCFNKISRAGISYFWSKIVVLLVDGLYVEATEAAKSPDALSALLEESNWIF